MDEINGWKPPVIYDVASDSKRIATQADIDNMVNALRILGDAVSKMREGLRIVDISLGRTPPDGL